MMFRGMKWGAVAVLTVASMGVQAQRMPVPIVDFKNMPVVPMAGQQVSAEHVKKALLAAAAQNRWELTPAGDGVFNARFVKEQRHTVGLVIAYSAAAYSVTYADSVNMKYEATDPARVVPTRYADAAAKQASHFASKPETAYAVTRPNELIHPFYEGWVRHLIDDVNRQLKVAQ